MKCIKFTIFVFVVMTLCSCKNGALSFGNKAETFADSARVRLGFVMNGVKKMPKEDAYKVVVENDSVCVFTFATEDSSIETEYYYMRGSKKTATYVECINKPTGRSGTMISIHEILDKHRGLLRFSKDNPKYQGLTDQQIVEDLAYRDMVMGCTLFGSVIEDW